MKITLVLLTMFVVFSGCGSSGVQGGFESDAPDLASIDVMDFETLEPAPENGTGFPRKYIIRKGDTLSQISERFYGTSVHWKKILDANPGIKPRELRIGQQIILPKIGY